MLATYQKFQQQMQLHDLSAIAEPLVYVNGRLADVS